MKKFFRSYLKNGRKNKAAATISRRDFLKYHGGAAGGALLLEVISKLGFWFHIEAAAKFKPEEYIGISRT
jgi:hypothetical protein